MTTDITPLAPTDAELMDLGHECELDAIEFGRAVLAKWGQPAQAAEPVAWLRNTTDPQPHAVTNLKYRSAVDAKAGVEYIPVFAAHQPVARADGFFLLLPQRPKPEAPAGTAGLDWDAYSGAQMLAFGRDCSDAAIAALRTEQPAPATQQAGEVGEVAEHYRNAIASACEGWTMPDGLRKHLETALWSQPTPQPTQAQAGAVPLTDEQIKTLMQAHRTAMLMTCKARVPECGEFAAIAQDLDWLCESFGIKGGQHGTE